jgi:diphosphomevalonate decarboxylase
MQSISASMPTNIALIKYMGKKEAQKNIPANASLSYTLNHLTSQVTLTPIEDTQDIWESVEPKERFIRHLDFLRETFQIKQYFKIQSENNFPTGCGLASSASSFAALTVVALKAFGVSVSREEQAHLSRQGSGSSCRSFFSPFVLWQEKSVQKITLPVENLIHHVIVVSREPKNISSSEAHRRVQTSALYAGREKRASQRLENLIYNFEQQNWEKAYYIIWQEFWDMFALFETAEKPFTYLLPESLMVLQYLRQQWEIDHDGPLVTMDAGPNVHVLFRKDQTATIEKLKAVFQNKFSIL